LKILEVKGLIKSFRKGFIPKKQVVLEGIDFSLSPGTVTGFLGANGAGKTTAMKCILGLAHPDSGEISFFNGKGLTPEVKNRIGFLPERPYFYEYLTGEEFLRFYGQLSTQIKRFDLNQRIERLLKKVDLFEARHKRLRSYSKGMLQKIGLAQALIHEPELVILDEPMSGLDPDGRYYLSELIRETAKSGACVFFSSHLLPDTERLCENLVILKDGRVIYQGDTVRLLTAQNDRVEIVAQKDGKLEYFTAENPSNANAKLKQLVENSYHILEMRSVRPSLEDAFIDLALKVKRR